MDIPTTDEKVGVDAGATAGYLGAASNDGVLRTGIGLSYTDGGNFVTLAYTGFGSAINEYLNASQLVTKTTFEIVEFDTELLDSGGEFNTTTHYFTATNTGSYLVCANLAFEAMTAGELCYVTCYTDKGEGTEVISIQKTEKVVTDGIHMVNVTKLIPLTAGQTFSVWAYHNHATDRNIIGVDPRQTSLSIVRMV